MCGGCPSNKEKQSSCTSFRRRQGPYQHALKRGMDLGRCEASVLSGCTAEARSDCENLCQGCGVSCAARALRKAACAKPNGPKLGLGLEKRPGFDAARGEHAHHVHHHEPLVQVPLNDAWRAAMYKSQKNEGPFHPFSVNPTWPHIHAIWCTQATT